MSAIKTNRHRWCQSHPYARLITSHEKPITQYFMVCSKRRQEGWPMNMSKHMPSCFDAMHALNFLGTCIVLTSYALVKPWFSQVKFSQNDSNKIFPVSLTRFWNRSLWRAIDVHNKRIFPIQKKVQIVSIPAVMFTKDAGSMRACWPSPKLT